MKKYIIGALIVLSLSFVCFAYANEVLSDMAINPNPMEKQTTITVVFNQSVRADVVIEAEDGTVIKTLFSGNMQAGRYEFVWNRLSNSGELVPNGRYNVSVNYETRYTSTKKTLILK